MLQLDSPRLRAVNQRQVRTSGGYVLYWMTAFRRPRWNHSLDRASAYATELKKPLLVLEALRVGYPWASDRLHQFVIDGMSDNRKAFDKAGVNYYPYLEPSAGEGEGLLEELAREAAVVITDDFPCFFLPRMITAAGRKLDAIGARLEAIDGNGLYPMRHTQRVFHRAVDFRRHLQKQVADLWDDFPKAGPLRRSMGSVSLPRSVTERWPSALDWLDGRRSVSDFPIDHQVGRVLEHGGERAARARLTRFLKSKLPLYDAERNAPDADSASGLSPYLHFGQLSPHEIFSRLAKLEAWAPGNESTKADGRRSGFWGMSEDAEAFLDQFLTWRELGFNMCAHRDDYDQYESLPAWARQTLEAHSSDPRPHLYSLRELEQAQTHDDIWNAAQRQLVREGRIHNYLRMLWGKKILEWTPHPRDALDVMIELNNKYALDGRDPNSYSGIFWTLGRYDRAWGPERPVFGKIRYMSSDNTRRKLKLAGYLEKYRG